MTAARSLVLLVVVAALTTTMTMTAAQNPTTAPSGPLPCRKFSQIYATGKELCENMFDQSFKYVPRSDPNSQYAYSMWYTSTTNGNDAITQARLSRGLTSPVPGNAQNQCYLRELHKAKPGPENLGTCYPFSQNACCAAANVDTPDKINDNYGPLWAWDRCGPLSAACEAFFVQEACFYECDPNVGLFRAFPPATYNASDPNQNEWQIVNMPIKGDYCDAWWTACKNDLFCATSDGSFFGCAREAAAEAPQTASASPLSPGAIAGIVIGVVAIVVLVVFLSVVVFNERRGTPIFMKLPPADAAPIAGQQQAGAQPQPQQAQQAQAQAQAQAQGGDKMVQI